MSFTTSCSNDEIVLNHEINILSCIFVLYWSVEWRGWVCNNSQESENCISTSSSSIRVNWEFSSNSGQLPHLCLWTKYTIKLQCGVSHGWQRKGDLMHCPWLNLLTKQPSCPTACQACQSWLNNSLANEIHVKLKRTLFILLHKMLKIKKEIEKYSLL